MMPGLDPKVDYAFKKIFGSEANTSILISLLEAVLKPPADQRIVALEILNPFNDKEAADDKLSILDIKARDQQGRQYNIEMQMIGSGIYTQRVLYYWAVLHSQQLREGADYGTLQATISISFVNSVLFPQVPDYHLDFQLRSSRHPELVFSALQSMHVLELPKFRRSAAQLSDPLDAWCYFLVHGEELDSDKLPEALRTPPVRQAMEVLQMLTQDDLERERYQSRLKAERDRISYFNEALATGLAKGRAQGLEEGRQEGRQEGAVLGEVLGKIYAFQLLLKLPLTPREELLAQPLAELKARVEAMARKLGVE